MGDILIQSKKLKKYFFDTGGWLSKQKNIVKAVDDVDLEIVQHETLALVGESGCGKSTLARLLINLLSPTDGEVLYKGENIFTLRAEAANQFKKQVQFIFQDPYACLNPRLKVVDIIGEPLTTHKLAVGKNKEIKVEHLMKLVGLRQEFMNRYPHQFSGGQRQRIGIARALALNPELLICDEPVSALDVSIQSQILNLLKDLQAQFGLTYFFISHNLSVVRYMADRVCVMFLGKVVELGNCEEIFEQPLHPYTSFLMNAAPVPNPKLRNRKRLLLEGEVPSPMNPPPGCRFHTRCPYVQEICRVEEPKLADYGGRKCACHFSLT
ncbi:Oligopeptide transport ATP-binding protein OppF [Sporomusa ovata DSM 2662]|uniref:Oligopeptide transport ATP-binding protein OppF (TC 3.A.1.5.1) n=1 Tax=Sporomusa ovata TaxID=2378 RepID=A0A0U1KS95_9FIRM|nr:dipeptide ABC transporter ATP-binding protein [Sporomusa ovata]EQB26206.1 oligopeptide transport ATP-binding protein AppF [Sporomusa ovata DSM 2662]CQR70281.1 Oligopeptide transport ATP-binding protein OppF (TC 3.A.1.5.1) [Sporomusa ovata]